MTPTTAATRPRRVRDLAICSVVAMSFLGACDTGDGTTLRDPTAPTTLPPPDTAPLPTEAIDGSAVAVPPPLDTLAGSSGSGSDVAAPTDADSNGLQLVTPWPDGGEIELRYSCDGINAAPAISWNGVPDGTAELAVAMVNETDVSQGRPFIHWVMAGISPDLGGLAENEVPAGAVQAVNYFGDVGYTGPCPDPGFTGTYALTVFAVSQQLELADETPATQMLDLIETVTIDSASSSGTFER